jgi:hypothetical protein
MIRAFCKFAVAAGLAVALVMPVRSDAALMADPEVLYAQMKDAFDKGSAHNWGYSDQLIYYSAILNAGRAYSLQHPDDPAYAELAALTVKIGAGIHYNPLTNHDGAVWWVREAAVWVTKNGTDTAQVQAANDLIARCNLLDAEGLARYADDDATATLKDFPRDTDALNTQLEADWRGWLLTGNAQWRSKALERVAAPNFPVANLPTTFGDAVVTTARSANAGVTGYTDADRANAKAFLARYDALGALHTIAQVNGMTHGKYLTTLAPADEYFGRLGYSILGIENQLKHVNFMLDYSYGNQESGETLTIVEAVEQMQKVYPRDRDMPMLLLSCITTLNRMSTDDARNASARLRGLLTVEYQDSPEAKKLLDPGT